MKPGKLYRYVGFEKAGTAFLYTYGPDGDHDTGAVIREVESDADVFISLGHHGPNPGSGWERVMAPDGCIHFLYVRKNGAYWEEVES
jgi:hypothetical protein